MSNSEKERISTLEANHISTMEKLDSIITRFDKFEEKLDKTFEKQDGKIGELNDHKNFLWGAYAVLVVTGGVIITLTINAINSKISDGIAQALKEQAIVEYEK